MLIFVVYYFLCFSKLFYYKTVNWDAVTQTIPLFRCVCIHLLRHVLLKL